MANKKLIVSDGNGKYCELSSSFSVDDGILTASTVVMQTSSWAAALSTPVSGIMQSFNGNLQPVLITSSIWENYDDSIDNAGSFTKGDLSGTLLQYRTGLKFGNGFGPHRIASASFNGDLVGSLSSSWPVKIISVANVTGGVLDSRFGGTGTSSFADTALVTLSGSGIIPAGNNNNVIATDVNSNWSAVNKTSIETGSILSSPLVYLYTGSEAGGQPFTGSWIKPSGCRFIRVICQGGGGGGGKPNVTSGSPAVATGGGGGGYCDVTFNADSIAATVSITASAGASGATSVNTSGTSGGSSYFGTYVYSTGGTGGSPGTVVGQGGIGYNYMGGSGSSQGSSTTSPDPLSNVYIGGAGGGGGGNSISNSFPRAGGSITLLGLTGSTPSTNISFGPPGVTPGAPQTGSLFNFNSVLKLNNLDNQPFPNLICAGGSGGGTGTPGGNGSSATFGSGGGGGGRSPTPGNGGNGGKGYVLIICT